MNELWNKTAEDVTGMSFVSEGTADETQLSQATESHSDRFVTMGYMPFDDPDDYLGYMPADNELSDGPAVRPVVGWFVCTRGEDVGRDFPVCDGYNVIGRSDVSAGSKPHVDLSDKHVSRDGAMVLSYDPLYNEYTLSKVTDSETVCRFNRKMIHGSIELKAYDRVTLGKKEEVELMFIPLCGEQFQWEEDEEEK